MDKSYIIKNKICEFGLHGDFKASVSLNRNKINKIKLILDFGQLLDEHVFFAMQSSAFITLMSKHRTVNSQQLMKSFAVPTVSCIMSLMQWFLSVGK